MKILLTNDDGIYAQGLNALYEVFSERHDVYIIAPDQERSACSNAFTTRSKLKVKRIAEDKFSVNGFSLPTIFF